MSQPNPGPISDGPADGEETRAEGLAARYQASYQVFWLIAVGIVGDASLAEDVVQDSALIALQKLDRFRPGTSFAAWAGQIVRNVARNRARKERSRRTASVDPAVIEETTATRAAAEPDVPLSRGGGLPVDQPYFDDRVMRALEAVSEVPRVCLLLRTLKGMEYSKIAQLLDIPAGTAMSHVHRTRRFLRKRLADLWAGGPQRGEELAP